MFVKEIEIRKVKSRIAYLESWSKADVDQSNIHKELGTLYSKLALIEQKL